MSSSNFKMFRRFSTPSSAGLGIADLYEHSDKMEYLHKCDHCGYWNLMDYADYIDDGDPNSGGNVRQMIKDGVDVAGRIVMPGTFDYVCKKCGKHLDRWYNGSWVSRFPERTANLDGIRGYRISQLNAVWISADQLKMEEMNSKSKQSFYNYNLGMPFTDTKLQVTDSDILDNGRFPEQKHNRDDYALIAAGIDWGVKHTLVVSGLRSNGEIDTIAQTQINSIPATSTVALGSDIEAIRVFLAPFDPDIIIADIGDAGERVSRLIQLYGKDKVFGCKYSSDPTTGLYGATGRINATWNENNNLVTVDKLVEHKRLIDRLKRHDIGFWRKQDANLLQIIEHWKNVIIRDEEQANGEMRQVITRKAGDHSASAQVYSVLGLEHLQEKYYGKDSYDFGFDYAGDNMAPTPTDIQEQLGITFN